MGKTYVVMSTKGGSGKSTISIMALPIVFADTKGPVNVYSIDNHNIVDIKSEYLNMKSLRLSEAKNIIDEVEFFQMINDDGVNIIDSGGGKDTLELLELIGKTKMKGLTYIVPIMDDIEQTFNLKKTVLAIKKISPDADIHLCLNRCNGYTEEAVKEQFIGFFGSQKYGISAAFDDIDDHINNVFMLRSSPMFSIVKSISQTTLLDAYHQGNDLLENLDKLKREWAKKGKETFMINNTKVRIAHDVNTLCAEIVDNFKALREES